jgi:hypothetical protein
VIKKKTYSNLRRVYPPYVMRKLAGIFHVHAMEYILKNKHEDAHDLEHSKNATYI